ncbi:T9SS type A sorting domain-containing protein [Hymenobacter sp. BT175]|uniref:T9SS type A sorting domain-containing protein n=1 Tax=Hymenobacter translucens TaxID=2886507 RepID=UPI001D0F25E0|nr:T9SS type A sorting domain-containing protein [Hymenobacter translucens]MCC2545267.1 T9SS type A sorting domain-containing protein [Hymenobacter translucens]
MRTTLRFSSCSLFSLLVMVLLANGAYAQAPNWSALATTSQTIGNGSVVQALAADASGNVYLAGQISGTVQFGSTSLTANGSVSSGMYVAKWNTSASRFEWAQLITGAFMGKVNGLAVSGSTIYICGHFSGLAGFGPFSLTSQGNKDGFVAKLTDNGATGSFTWARGLGGTSDDEATALAVQGTRVYVAGSFWSPALDLGGSVVTNSGPVNTMDMFVARLSDSGAGNSLDWVQQARGTNYEDATSLAVSGTSIYVAGTFNSAPSSFGSAAVSSAGGVDIYVAKLTDTGTSGNFNWVQRAGGPAYDEVGGLAVNAANVYVAGSFQGPTADFGSTNLATAGINSDIFVAKLTDGGSSGSFTWAQRAGGQNPESVTGLQVLGPYVYVAGNFTSSTIDFGSTTLRLQGGADVFVARLLNAGSTGRFEWAKRAGGEWSDFAGDLAVQGTSVLVAGSVQPIASFDSYSVTGPVGMPPARGTVAYVATLNDLMLATTAASSLAGLSVFPNPAPGRVTVQLPALSGVSQITVTLTDVLNRVVRAYPVGLTGEGLRQELDLTGVVPGVYLLRVQAGSAETVRRLLVK